MNRRLFFGSLAALPLIAIEVAKKPKRVTALPTGFTEGTPVEIELSGCSCPNPMLTFRELDA